MINNVEENIMADLFCYARGRGGIKESEIFERAYSMISGINSDSSLSRLNALQSYNIFESIKKMITFEGLRVIEQPQLTIEEIEESEHYMHILRQDTIIAHKLKIGIIKKENFQQNQMQEKNPMQRIHWNLLAILYGLNDGIVKSRWPENERVSGQYAEYVERLEIRSLRKIWNFEQENIESIKNTEI